MGETKETFSPDNLIAGDFPIVTEIEVVLTGTENLGRGSVLGQITAGNYQLTDPKASDGSQNPVYLLINRFTATGSPTTVPGYQSGEFNASKIVLGGTGVAADVKAALRDLNIYLKAASDR